MADEPQARSTSKWLLIVALIALVVLLLWQFGMFGTGQEDVEPTYEAGVTDASGGELIVSDPDAEGVPVDVPDTPMTPVPAESPSPAAE
jgi:hypothetical protein